MVERGGPPGLSQGTSEGTLVSLDLDANVDGSLKPEAFWCWVWLWLWIWLWFVFCEGSGDSGRRGDRNSDGDSDI